MWKKLAILGCTAFAAAACGDSDDAGDASSEHLLGDWELVDDESDRVIAEYSFDEEGRFTFVEYGEGAESFTGTYETEAGLLRFDGADDEGKPGIGEVTYFADQTLFALGTLLPVDDVDGPVGRWEGRFYSEVDGQVETDSDSTYELRADGTASVTSVEEGEDSTYEATWVDEAGEIVVSFQVEPELTINVHMELIEGEALGGFMLTRPD